ncbi:MAG: basic amino acid ABC transporter substrate-binding protein [Oscillospiraceae bacterium]|nr:basic amino acid ABC transporter substrate-binding protein [Oscillospiraceae bacterium]
MKLSKILCGALAAVMTLSLAGCGGEKKTTLVMATNAEFPPYEYRDGENFAGIDVEIAQAIAEDMGLDLVIEDMQFDSIVPAVQSGKADIGIAGMTVTEDKLQNIDFSIPYTTSTQVVIVTNDSPIASPADLEGKTIGVQLGTTGDQYSSEIENATIERYNKGFEAVQALGQNKIDAVIIDREPAKVFVSENEGLKILDEDYTVEDYAIAIAKNNHELLEQVNNSLTKLNDSGKLQEIIDKYISAD